MKLYDIQNLVKQRMELSHNIAHYRLMIKCGYHPDFFLELLINAQVEQRDILRQERELNKR